MRKVSGTARPPVVAPACGLMFAAMLGAISAIESPTAAHTDSERFRPGVLAEPTSICSSFGPCRPLQCPSGPPATEEAKIWQWYVTSPFTFASPAPPSVAAARGDVLTGIGKGDCTFLPLRASPKYELVVLGVTYGDRCLSGASAGVGQAGPAVDANLPRHAGIGRRGPPLRERVAGRLPGQGDAGGMRVGVCRQRGRAHRLRAGRRVHRRGHPPARWRGASL